MTEKLTPEQVQAFLHEQVVGRIGCHADGELYVVPVIYAYDGECVYVQTIEGRKIRMMRANPEVCFELDEYRSQTGSWRSVIAYGTYEELEGADRERALQLLVERFRRPGAEPRERPAAPEGVKPVAFRIRLRTATGRTVRR